MTQEQRDSLKKMFPEGYLILVGTGDGKKVELEFKTDGKLNDNSTFFNAMHAGLKSCGIWSDQKVYVRDLGMFH